jgi:hypothetical protein
MEENPCPKPQQKTGKAEEISMMFIFLLPFLSRHPPVPSSPGPRHGVRGIVKKSGHLNPGVVE